MNFKKTQAVNVGTVKNKLPSSKTVNPETTIPSSPSSQLTESITPLLIQTQH